MKALRFLIQLGHIDLSYVKKGVGYETWDIKIATLIQQIEKFNSTVPDVRNDSLISHTHIRDIVYDMLLSQQITEKNTVENGKVPTLVTGTDKDGCSDCSLLERFMNTEVPIAFEKIQDLKAKGQVQEANKIIDVIENKANHFMRNKLVRTGIDAAVSGLRLEVNPISALQEDALRKIALAISVVKKELAASSNDLDQKELTTYASQLTDQQKIIQDKPVTPATLAQRLGVWGHNAWVLMRRAFNTPRHWIGDMRSGVETEVEQDTAPQQVREPPREQSGTTRSINTIVTAKQNVIFRRERFDYLLAS